MTPKKILLMYISEHSGHHQAAIALEKAILKIAPGSDILSINAFSYVNPLMEKIIHKVYMRVIKKRPEIWGYLYDNPKVVKKTEWLRNFLNDRNSRKIDKLIKKFEPDVVACTQAFPCGIFASYKKRHKKNIPLVAILTDYAPHSYWIYDNVNAYVVPSTEVSESLVQKGVSKDKIKILGVPIDPSFAAPIDKNDVCKRLNVSSEAPVVLVMGGTHGIGPDEKLIQALAASKKKFNIIVITGINEQLFKKVKEIEQHSRKLACDQDFQTVPWGNSGNGHCSMFPDKAGDKQYLYTFLCPKKEIITLGFVNNVHEIMGISDVIITKPGGLTTAEALAKTLPIIILNPLPGQEDFNTNVFTQKGIAIKARDEVDALSILEELLHNIVKLERMRKIMAENARPNSATEIANLLLRLANPVRPLNTHCSK